MKKAQRDTYNPRMRAALAGVLLAVLAVAPGKALSAERLHLRLEASSPVADETVSNVRKIQLEFSQAPQLAGTRIRVLSAGEPLDLGDAVISDRDDTVVLLALSDGLEDGAYEVRWRAMSQDGHPVTGDFAFNVVAQTR